MPGGFSGSRFGISPEFEGAVVAGRGAGAEGANESPEPGVELGAVLGAGGAEEEGRGVNEGTKESRSGRGWTGEEDAAGGFGFDAGAGVAIGTTAEALGIG